MGAKTTVEVYHRHFPLTILQTIAALGEDILVVEVLDYRTARYDADEHVAVIDDWNEVRLHRTDYQIIDGRSDKAGRILGGQREHIGETEVFKLLDGHCVRFAALALDYEPEKVAFADRADICAVAPENGDSRILAGMHLLECLADSKVAVNKCNILLGAHKKSYVHNTYSIPRSLSINTWKGVAVRPF